VQPAGADPVGASFIFLDLPIDSPRAILLILRSARHMRMRAPT
jgi:hypothetical protein